MRYSVAEEGFPVCAGTLLFSAGLLAFDFTMAGSILFLLFLAETFFFRDPDRFRQPIPGAVLSPADGKVLHAGQSEISIFMSLFNVHINRIPIGGVVDSIHYKKGKFKAAYRGVAEKENEQNTVILKSILGDVTVTQIAGVIARRIVCKLQEGEKVLSGQRFGMIKFGSRIRITLPPNAKINVRIGDKVKAGITVIAHGKERGT
jgi:phosphatidylserine decarboxylase